MKGTTVHSTLYIDGRNNVSLERLGRSTPEARDLWRPLQLLMGDEMSMWDPRLFGALSYRACLLRQTPEHDTHPELYIEPEHAFGGIPLVVFSGDFLQLAPIGAGKKAVQCEVAAC